MEEKKNNNGLIWLIIILIILVLAIISFLFYNQVNSNNEKNKGLTTQKNFIDKNDNSDITEKKVKYTLENINFLKQENCSDFDLYYGIEIIGPELFLVPDCNSDDIKYRLVNKNKEIIGSDLKKGIIRVYDDYFINASSYSGNSGYNVEFYDKKGNLKLSSNELIFLSENLIFIGNEIDGLGKIYNLSESKYSDEYKILQFVNDDLILTQDSNSNIKIIDSEFTVIKNFGKTKDEYILLNSKHLFNKTKGELINFETNKSIVKKYDEYYPFYNDFVEVCYNDKCGIINLINNKIIVPIKYIEIAKSLDYNDLFQIGSETFSKFNELIIVEDKHIYNFDGKNLFNFETESFLSELNNNYYVQNFEDSIFKIFDFNGKVFYEDKTLYTINSAYYNSNFYYNKYLAYVPKDNKEEKMGIIDYKGNVLQNFKYDYIEIYAGCYIITHNEQYAIYNYKNEEILPFGNYDIDLQNSNNEYEILMIHNLDNDNLQMLVTTYE